MSQTNNQYSPAAPLTMETARVRFNAYTTEAPEALTYTHTVDHSSQLIDDANMNTLSREELDTKLQLIEAKMDARVSAIAGKIDSALTKMDGNEKVITLIAEKAAIASQSAAESAARAGGLKSTLWLTSITTILAVLGIALAAYFGTQQSNIGIVQSTIAAAESGKTLATTQAEIKRQSEETAALLKQMQEQLKPPPSKQPKESTR